MKNIFCAILLFVFSSQAHAATLKNHEQKYLFEDSHINFSWGFQYRGRFVMTDGTIWCFDSSRNNDAKSFLRETNGYYSHESIDKSSLLSG